MKPSVVKRFATLTHYDLHPLLDNPWMHQERNGNLVITDGRATRTYDLTNWKITDSRVSAASK